MPHTGLIHAAVGGAGRRHSGRLYRRCLVGSSDLPYRRSGRLHRLANGGLYPKDDQGPTEKQS